MNIWKKMTAVFCMVLAVGLVGIFTVQRKQEEEEGRRLSDLNTEIQQLKKEKSNLEQELQELTNGDAQQETEQSTGVVCFTFIDQSLFTQAYPKLQTRGYTGIFILRNGRLPGDYNTVTVEQCIKLLDAGWEYGISLNDDFNSEVGWQEAVQEYLDKLNDRIGILPSVYYFEEGNYNSDSVEFLAKKNISTVLYSAGEQTEIVEGVMQLPMYGYMDDLSELEAGTMLGLNVQMIWDNNVEEQYRYTVDCLSDVLEHTDMVISDIPAMQMLMQQKEEQEEQLRLKSPEINALKEQILEIDEKIRKIYH